MNAMSIQANQTKDVVPLFSKMEAEVILCNHVKLTNAYLLYRPEIDPLRYCVCFFNRERKITHHFFDIRLHTPITRLAWNLWDKKNGKTTLPLSERTILPPLLRKDEQIILYIREKYGDSQIINFCVPSIFISQKNNQSLEPTSPLHLNRQNLSETESDSESDHTSQT
jgi:hypothetical protein